MRPADADADAAPPPPAGRKGTLLLCSLLALSTIAAATFAAGARAAGQPQKIIIDTDPVSDYDDLVTIWTAAVSPELDLLGVVIGSLKIEKSVAAAGRALAIVGREDVGVYEGLEPNAPKPAFDYWSQFPRRRWSRHPKLDLFGNGFPFRPSPQSGVDFYLDAVRSHPGEVSVIVTGSMTTLAEAIRKADRLGFGSEFRRDVKQILFNGGDFATSEYNIYIDVPAARLVFESGIPIYQFGGEGEGKAYLRHRDRTRLWDARTPLTWAMQDLYRLYDAGTDPTSPFVPILYDVHPVAFLIAGQGISRFEKIAVRIDPDGFLRRTGGKPNIYTRVANRGDLLVDFVVDRLRSPEQPAANHLRCAARLIPAGPPSDACRGLQQSLDQAAAMILAPRSGVGTETAARREALSAQLDAAAARLSCLGEGEAEARRHLDAARAFLFGEARASAWRDPYTDRYVPLYVFWITLPKLRIAAALMGLLFLLAVAGAARAWRRSRHRAKPAGTAGPVRPAMRLLAVLVGLAIAAVAVTAAELGYRLLIVHSLRLPQKTWIADARLIYRLNPSHRDFPRSFRGKAPGSEADARVHIVCVGGSTTYGSGVGESESWPHVVEDVLRSRGIRAEVINAGVPGYGVRQDLLRYESEILSSHPEFVVVNSGWNRTGALVDDLCWVPYGVPRPGDGGLRRLGLALGDHSLLFRKAFQAAVGDGNRWFGHEWVMDPYQDVFANDLKTLANEIGAHGAHAVLLLYPALYYEGITPEEIALFQPMLSEHRAYKPEMLLELERKHAAIREAARASGAMLVDLQAAFAGYTGAKRKELFFDEMHLTVRGNRLAGEALGSALAGRIDSTPP